MAMTQEGIMAHYAEKKRKAPTGPSNAPPQRYHLVQTVAPQVPQNAPQQGRWVLRNSTTAESYYSHCSSAKWP